MQFKRNVGEYCGISFTKKTSAHSLTFLSFLLRWIRNHHRHQTYHQINQANGLCFSVPEGVLFPPSLKNINKELQVDLGISLASGNLLNWANQGVLLINSILTVEDSLPGSHANIGWLTFTKLILNELNQQKSGLVFMLWGNYAQKLGKDLDPTKHHIIKTSHPSPLSANRGGWFGTRPFSKANSFLDVPILWA